MTKEIENELSYLDEKFKFNAVDLLLIRQCIGYIKRKKISAQELLNLKTKLDAHIKILDIKYFFK